MYIYIQVQTQIDGVDRQISNLRKNGSEDQARFKGSINDMDQSYNVMKDVQKMRQFNDIENDLETDQGLDSLEQNIPV